MEFDDEAEAVLILAHAVRDEIRLQGLTQSQAAERLGVAQPDISRIANVQPETLDSLRFGPWRLLRMLADLDKCVEVIVRPKKSFDDVPKIVIS